MKKADAVGLNLPGKERIAITQQPVQLITGRMVATGRTRATGCRMATAPTP